MRDRYWEASMAPTYVGNSTDCGLTVGERATLDIAAAMIVATPKLMDSPDKLADQAVVIAKAILNRCWKEKTVSGTSALAAPAA